MLAFIKKHQKYFAVLGGFLVHLSFGGFYTTGHVKQLIVAYMSNNSLSKGTLKQHDGVWIVGLIAFAQGSAISAGGYLEKKIGTSMTVLLGGWLMSLNVCFTFLTIKTYFFVVVLTYGLLAGIGTGLAYGVALGVPCKKFPNHKGLVIGIILSGYGISPAIFDVLQNYVISRNINNLPISFIVVGLCYAVLQFIGSLFLKEHVNIQITDNSIQTYIEEDYAEQFLSFGEPPNFKPHQLLFEIDFWILWLTFVMNSTCVVLLVSSYYNFGNVLGLSDYGIFGQITIVSVVAAIFNFSGRIFWGIVIDKKPYKIIMIIVCLSTSFLIGTINILFKINDHETKLYLYGLWIAFLNFCQSGNFVIFPRTIAKLFGMNDFVCNYGVLFTSCSFSATIVSISTDLASNENQIPSNSILISFIVGCVLSFLAATITLLFRGKSLMTLR